jgi:hypothetical protein
MRPARKSSLPVRPLNSGAAKIDHMRLQVPPRMPARAQRTTLAANPAFRAQLDGGRAPTGVDNTVPTATGRDVTADLLHRPADTGKDAGS